MNSDAPKRQTQDYGDNRAKFKMTALHRSYFLVGVWEESIDHVATLPLLGAALHRCSVRTTIMHMLGIITPCRFLSRCLS